MSSIRRPVNQIRDSRQRATSCSWQTGTGISGVRRNLRWNLRDSVEERNPMLLLGRPLGARAARVGGLPSTGRIGDHESAAAAASFPVGGGLHGFLMILALQASAVSRDERGQGFFFALFPTRKKCEAHPTGRCGAGGGGQPMDTGCLRGGALRPSCLRVLRVPWRVVGVWWNPDRPGSPEWSWWMDGHHRHRAWVPAGGDVSVIMQRQFQQSFEFVIGPQILLLKVLDIAVLPQRLGLGFWLRPCDHAATSFSCWAVLACAWLCLDRYRGVDKTERVTMRQSADAFSRILDSCSRCSHLEIWSTISSRPCIWQACFCIWVLP